MKNFLYLFLITSAVGVSAIADAQQVGKVPRIGFMRNSTPGSNVSGLEAFRQGLRDLGYIEGKNILVEYRDIEGKIDRIPSLVAELVRLKVDVLVLPNVLAIRTAKEATKTIPIVMLTN